MGGRRLRRTLGAGCVLCGLALAPAAAHAQSFSDGFGLHVLSARQLDARQFQLMVSTPAINGPVELRVLLPSGYGSEPSRRYPVLYLLHGTSGGPGDWITMGNAEQTTAGLPLIVVLPAIAQNNDGGGWCTNWVNGGAYGQPQWETFHIDQVIPWVDGNLRTIASREGRAIAGLSQGGFCSTSYPARHPDLFGVSLAYSGAPDIAYDTDTQAGATAIINATETFLDGVPPNSMFGDRASDEVNWAAHDPTTLAENLRDTKLYMYFGNGQPGPYDSNPVNPYGSSIEQAVWRDNVEFHNRLVSLGIPSYYDDYGPGTHSWPYWARDLQQSIGPLMSDLAHPLTPPRTVFYESGDDSYSVYGWQVTLHRLAREFSTLGRADASGFTLSGSGSATVSTPPFYGPGSVHALSIASQQGTSAVRLRADDAGRLRIDVPLGPSNPYQQYTAQADAAGTNVFDTAVTIYPSASATASRPALRRPATCPRRGRITVRLPRGLRIRALAVYVNGRHVTARRLARRRLRFALGGSARTFRVAIRIRGARGHRLVLRHTYRRCTGRRRLSGT